MRYALDILAILVLLPKVQLLLGTTVVVLDENNSPVSTPGQENLVCPSSPPPCQPSDGSLLLLQV